MTVILRMCEQCGNADCLQIVGTVFFKYLHPPQKSIFSSELKPKNLVHTPVGFYRLKVFRVDLKIIPYLSRLS